jgi:hypothetical protein
MSARLVNSLYCHGLVSMLQLSRREEEAPMEGPTDDPRGAPRNAEMRIWWRSRPNGVRSERTDGEAPPRC